MVTLEVEMIHATNKETSFLVPLPPLASCGPCGASPTQPFIMWARWWDSMISEDRLVQSLKIVIHDMTNIFSYLYIFYYRKRLYVWLWSKKEKDSALKIHFMLWDNPLWIFHHWAVFLLKSPLIRWAQEERGFAVRQYGVLWWSMAPSVGPGIWREGCFRGALLGLGSRGAGIRNT